MALNLSGLPNVPMRIIFLVMFVMVTWAIVDSGWLGLSYALSNYFVVLLGIWAERDTPSPVPVQMFFFGMVFTLLNDIISLGVTFSPAQYRYKVNDNSNLFNFNAACAILLVLFKPVALLFIYREWTVRVGGEVGSDPQGNSNYEPLGSNGPTAPGGYGGIYEKSDNPPQYQPPTQPFP